MKYNDWADIVNYPIDKSLNLTIFELVILVGSTILAIKYIKVLLKKTSKQKIEKEIDFEYLEGVRKEALAVLELNRQKYVIKIKEIEMNIRLIEEEAGEEKKDRIKQEELSRRRKEEQEQEENKKKKECESEAERILASEKANNVTHIELLKEQAKILIKQAKRRLKI